MKKFLVMCLAVVAMAACSSDYDDSAVLNQIGELEQEMTQLEQQINALNEQAEQINDDIAVLQAIANGITITSVESAADGGYTVTFSNGESYTIAQGTKGDKGEQGDKGDKGEKGDDAVTPLFRIDAEGYWQVSYDNGATWLYPNGVKVSALGQQGNAGDKGDKGEQGATPRLSVDAEGYWTVSYDGVTYERLKDAAGNDVKAVAEGVTIPEYDSVFASATLSADGQTLTLVLVGSSEPIVVPVGGKLATLLYNGEAVEGVQTFALGESRNYTVEADAAFVKVVGQPDGWKAQYAAPTLTVTAPAEVVAAVAAVADSSTDVSLLVVLNNGLTTILRMQVALDSTTNPDQGGDDPDQGGTTGGEVKTFMLDAATVKASAAADIAAIPGNKNDLAAQLEPAYNLWAWNDFNFESRFAMTTSSDAAGVKIPVFYFYKTSAVANIATYITNTTSFGEIQKITMTLIDNGAKKGNLFTMTETIGGVEQTVLSSNDNTASVEHVYTFSAGNNGIFKFTNPVDQDCKVVAFSIEYN